MSAESLKNSFAAASWLVGKHPTARQELILEKNPDELMSENVCLTRHSPSCPSHTYQAKSYQEQPYEMCPLPQFMPKPCLAAQQQCQTSLPAFDPKSFLTQLWQGDSLSSKESIECRKLCSYFIDDVKNEIKTKDYFTQKIIELIYEEFINFSSYNGLNIPHLDNRERFWEELRNENAKNRQELDNFLDLYTAKIITLFFCKLRFIKLASKELKISVKPHELIMPQRFFLKLFPIGSSREIDVDVFKSHQFSWYQPKRKDIDMLQQLFDICDDISSPEISKNFSIFTNLPIQGSNQVSDQSFSHSLSHKLFGLFLNQINISFPQWFEHSQHSSQRVSPPSSITSGHSSEKKPLEVVSTYFTGDYLDELSLSHWLAQENNGYFKWDQIICPQFVKEGKRGPTYTSLINEVQFLTFLIKIYQHHNHNIVDFIASTIRDYQQSKLDYIDPQKSFFLDDLGKEERYQVVILSSIRSDKNNSHFHLLSKIREKLKRVQDGGQLIVLSSQNLFVPSQSEKVENLLKQIKLRACINLEKLKGKGQVPNYIYLFTKSYNNESVAGQNVAVHEGQPSLTYRLSGQLGSFYDFANINKIFYEFFSKHWDHLPTLYEQEAGGIKLEFFHEAIVKGKLIHSGIDQTGGVTHPAFFKNLMNNCLPLDYFFDLQQLDQEFFWNNHHPIPTHKGNLIYRQELTSTDFCLIANLTDQQTPKLEIVHVSLIKAKAIEKGFTQCFYFRLTPKVRGININIFKDYFVSKIGEQITCFSFVGNNKQIKSKVGRILIPKIFLNHHPANDGIKLSTQILDLNDDNFERIDWKKFRENLSSAQGMLKRFAHKCPGHILEKISKLHTTLVREGEKIQWCSKNPKDIDFSSPALQKELIRIPSNAIYPHHDDIYMEFLAESSQHIQSHLSKIQWLGADQVHHEVDSDEKVLALCSDHTAVIHLYGKIEVLSFIAYIANQVTGTTIMDFVTSLHLPDTNELRKLIKSQKQRKKDIDQIINLVKDFREQLFVQLISV